MKAMKATFFFALTFLAGFSHALETETSFEIGVKVVTPYALSAADATAVRAAETDILETPAFSNDVLTIEGDANRNLRGDRDLCGRCCQICKNIRPGQCYAIYGWCYGYRRLEEGNDVDASKVEVRELGTDAATALQDECELKKAIVRESFRAVVSAADENAIDEAKMTCFIAEAI